MISKSSLKMARTFDQAVFDEPAFTSFFVKNVSLDELEPLIAQMEDLEINGIDTRTTKDKFCQLQSCQELSTELKDSGESVCTAVFETDAEMAKDPKYNEDQTAFKDWIGEAEDAPSELIEKFEKLELIDKLEESGMDIVTFSLQAPPAACNTNAILLQMSK